MWGDEATPIPDTIKSLIHLINQVNLHKIIKNNNKKFKLFLFIGFDVRADI